MPKRTTVDKNPRIVKVTWTNDDEWDNGNPRIFEAWVAEPALKPWLSSLSVTEAWNVEVSK